MPVYNSQETLKGAVESVLNQTYSNWELLITDDCSSDNSVNIIDELRLGYSKKIKLFKTKKNSGPAAARNISIKNAIGELISFLDSDDIWMPEKLSKQVQFITENDYSVVFANYEKISFDGLRNNRVVKLPRIVDHCSILKSNSIPCLTAMYNINKIGKQYQLEDRKFVSTEDYIMWLGILKSGVTAYGMQEVLALYRLSKYSISKNKFQMAKIRWRIYISVERLSFAKAIYSYICYITIGFSKFLK